MLLKSNRRRDIPVKKASITKMTVDLLNTESQKSLGELLDRTEVAGFNS